MTTKAPPPAVGKKPKVTPPAAPVAVLVTRTPTPGTDTTQPVVTAPKPKIVTANPVVGKAKY